MGGTTTRLTIEDFERLPLEQVKDHELVDGEPVDVSGNTLEHNSSQVFLSSEMWLFVRARQRFPFTPKQAIASSGKVLDWPPRSCQAFRSALAAYLKPSDSSAIFILRAIRNASSSDCS